MTSEFDNRVEFSNLSYRTTENSLRHYFLQYGSIEKLVLYRDDQEQSLRQGYLIYQDRNSVHDVMGQRPHTIDQRQIFLRRFIPHPSSMRHVSPSESLANQLIVNEIFISRLSSGERKELFIHYFQRFGTVVDCRVFHPSASNSKSMGYAFVRFEDYDSVDQVILSRPHQINMKSYPVRKCIPREYNYIVSAVKPLSSNKPIWRHYALGLINMQTQTILYPSRLHVINQPKEKNATDELPPRSAIDSSPCNDFELVNAASSMSSSISIVNSIEDDFTPLPSPLYSTAIAYSPNTDLI